MRVVAGEEAGKEHRRLSFISEDGADIMWVPAKKMYSLHGLPSCDHEHALRSLLSFIEISTSFQRWFEQLAQRTPTIIEIKEGNQD